MPNSRRAEPPACRSEYYKDGTSKACVQKRAPANRIGRVTDRYRLNGNWDRGSRAAREAPSESRNDALCCGNYVLCILECLTVAYLQTLVAPAEVAP